MIGTHRQVVKFGSLLGLIIILALTGYTLVGKDRNSVAIYRRPELSFPENCVAQGLRLDEELEGKRVFSLKVDTIRILGKKAGFLRLGFWKVARLENVCLDFYQQADGNREQKTPAGLPATNGRYGHGFPDLFDLFAGDDGLKLPRLDGVKGIEMSNIKLRIHRAGKIILALSSDKAEINPHAKELIFQGNVRIASGKSRLLETGEIRWLRDEKKFRTTDRYRVKTQGGIMEGKGLEADYLLEKIALTGKGK